MAELLDYLQKAVEDHASDLFLMVGSPVYEKKDKRLIPIEPDRMLLPQMAEELVTQIYERAGRSMEHYLQAGDDDFSFSVKGVLSRFRVNTYRQRGSMAAVVRVVPFGIPDWRDMGIPAEVMKLAEETEGMVLVTGTAGNGKSTTQACIIDRINQTRSGHIITLEDPIEYLHRNNNGGNGDGIRSVVSQREIGIDTEDYLSALRSCLRQAPDVILLGEMRDRDTIHTAMTAAETGHLLIATLHTKGAVNTVDRIVDSFPGDQQEQIRAQLSMVLKTVVSQQLLPGKNGGMVPAFEIMHVTPAIQRKIRDNMSNQIDDDIAYGKEEGMISMDQYILELYEGGRITQETALDHADNREQMQRWIG